MSSPAPDPPGADPGILDSQANVPGTTLQWGTESVEGEFLVLTVRPTRPGLADIDSFTFDYTRDDAHGGQGGVERLDNQQFVVRAN
ncbi:hypothetical protein GCM10027020_17520 [Nocardioides salsibiostraticola]